MNFRKQFLRAWEVPPPVPPTPGGYHLGLLACTGFVCCCYLTYLQKQPCLKHEQFILPGMFPCPLSLHFLNKNNSTSQSQIPIHSRKNLGTFGGPLIRAPPHSKDSCFPLEFTGWLSYKHHSLM